MRYQQQASRQTLGEGIAEYLAANPDLKRGAELPDAAREFFRCHDAVHREPRMGEIREAFGIRVAH
jgi:hypothetical protein